MKNYKQLLIVLAVGTFIVPQIVFAAWWNPMSWSIWNIFRPTFKTQVLTATTTIPTVTANKKNDTNIIQDNLKNNQDLQTSSSKKQTADLIQNTNQSKTEKQKTTIVTLTSGAVVEVDEKNNIIKTIQVAPQQTFTQTPVVNQTQNQTLSPVTQQTQTTLPPTSVTPSCTYDTWNCSDWSACSNSGLQTRVCNMTFNCSVANTPSPDTTRSCTPAVPVVINTVPVVPPVTPFVSDMSEVNVTSNSADISFNVKKYGVWTEIEWSESNTFNPDIFNVQRIDNWCSYSNNTVHNVTLQQPKFKPSTTYYYRIIGKDGCPNLGNMIPQDYALTLMDLQHTFQYSSDVRSFKTLPPPAFIATNPYPDDGATNVSTSTSLTWSIGDGTISNAIYIGQGDAGESKYINSQLNSTYTPNLLPNTAYYWRIDEINTTSTTTGRWWRFSTGASF